MIKTQPTISDVGANSFPIEIGVLAKEVLATVVVPTVHIPAFGPLIESENKVTLKHGSADGTWEKLPLQL